MPEARILVVEDDVSIRTGLRVTMELEGFAVEEACDGPEAMRKLPVFLPDIILLDLMLPGMSGYRVLEALRAAGVDTPVLMLTAKDGEYDEADALDLGADDYVTKPFSTVVLLARMSALLRRRPDVAPVLTVGRLRLEPRRHRCWVDDNEVMLTAREYAVLTYLAERVDQAVSKQELLDEVWEESGLDPNVVEVCVMQLRKKVGSDVIQTVRNVGYRLVEQPA